MEDFYNYIKEILNTENGNADLPNEQKALRSVEYKMYEIPKEFHEVFAGRLLASISYDYEFIFDEWEAFQWKDKSVEDIVDEYKVKESISDEESDSIREYIDAKKRLHGEMEENSNICCKMTDLNSLLGGLGELFEHFGYNINEIAGKIDLIHYFNYFDNIDLDWYKYKYEREDIPKKLIPLNSWNKSILKQSQISVLSRYLKTKNIFNRSITDISISHLMSGLTGYSSNTIRQSLGKSTNELLSEKKEADEIIDALKSVIEELEKDKKMLKD